MHAVALFLRLLATIPRPCLPSASDRALLQPIKRVNRHDLWRLYDSPRCISALAPNTPVKYVYPYTQMVHMKPLYIVLILLLLHAYAIQKRHTGLVGLRFCVSKSALMTPSKWLPTRPATPVARSMNVFVASTHIMRFLPSANTPRFLTQMSVRNSFSKSDSVLIALALTLPCICGAYAYLRGTCHLVTRRGGNIK